MFGGRNDMTTEEKWTTVEVSLPDELIAKIMSRRGEGDDPETHLKGFVYGAVESSMQMREEVEEWQQWRKLSPEGKEEYFRKHPEKRGKFG
jgi:hypothetical protein